MNEPLLPLASRRCFLRRSAGIAAVAGITAAWPGTACRATPQAMRQAIRDIVGEVELGAAGSRSMCRRWSRTAIPFR